MHVTSHQLLMPARLAVPATMSPCWLDRAVNTASESGQPRTVAASLVKVRWHDLLSSRRARLHSLLTASLRAAMQQGSMAPQPRKNDSERSTLVAPYRTARVLKAGLQLLGACSASSSITCNISMPNMRPSKRCTGRQGAHMSGRTVHQHAWLFRVSGIARLSILSVLLIPLLDCVELDRVESLFLCHRQASLSSLTQHHVLEKTVCTLLPSLGLFHQLARALVEGDVYAKQGQQQGPRIDAA